MNQDRLQAMLTRVQRGLLDVPDALRQLRTLPYEDLGFASLDHHRAIRQGFPEVIFCEGKTERQVVAIERMRDQQRVVGGSSMVQKLLNLMMKRSSSRNGVPATWLAS